MSLRTRLGKLEGAARNNAPVVIWKRPQETPEMAIARWKASNPNAGDPPIQINEIRRTIVDPPIQSRTHAFDLAQGDSE
jgi:hypothetical protein